MRKTLFCDARDLLLDPYAVLFAKIYSTGLLPEQWKISKVIPIFKKGDKNKIENYRPIANLCSSSKFFEKLILKQIKQIFGITKLSHIMLKKRIYLGSTLSQTMAACLFSLLV